MNELLLIFTTAFFIGMMFYIVKLISKSDNTSTH
jgi:hypothetical protein